MTTNQRRIAAIAAALALPVGLTMAAIGSANNAPHGSPAAAQPAHMLAHESPDNDVETNDDGPGAKAAAKGDGDGETNDDGPDRAGEKSR